MAKICLISDQPVEKERASQLAELAINTGSGSNIFYWFQLARGIAAYRQGQFD